MEATADDGFHWTELGRIDGPRDDAAFSTESFDISAFKAAFTEIRFRNALDASDGHDQVYIDNVQVAFDGVYFDGASRPSQIGADELHAEGITGYGVTVAVIDTGFWDREGLDTTAMGYRRAKVQYDAIRNQVDCINCAVSTDVVGHGSHVTSLIMNSETDRGSALLRGRARRHSGDHQGLQSHRRRHLCRCHSRDRLRGPEQGHLRHPGSQLLVLGAAAAPTTGKTPSTRPIMAAWQAGIVVVASAGNTGPDPMTVGVPGNVPYIITVGAMSDGFTPGRPERRLSRARSPRPVRPTRASSNPMSSPRADTSGA